MSCRGQDVSFEVHFSAASTAVWWGLFAAASAVWFHHRNSKSKSMILYKFLFTVIAINALSETIYLGWINGIAHHHSAKFAYYLYILVSKLALSSFVALMLTGAAGFCITRDDLGPHTARVIGVPLVWLISGWVTGYIWYYTQGAPDDWCTLAVKEMSSWQSGVWFVCSIVNLATYLMAWIYIFSIMGEELEIIEATETALANLRQTVGGAAPTAQYTATERVVKSLLLPDGNRSHLGADDVPVRAPPEVDVETAAQLDTFAGRIDFELKKKLLYRFALGCAAYLTALICVLLLPLFSVTVLDSTLWALESIVKWGFIASLIYIFRPTVQNPYLSLDLQDNADLTTELTMMEDDDNPAATAAAPSRPPVYPKPPRHPTSAPLDVAPARDQSPASLPLSTTAPSASSTPTSAKGPEATTTTTTTTARAEHNKKFSLEEDEDEHMVDIKLQAAEDRV